MASFSAYRDEYGRIWNSLQIRPERLAEARRDAQKLLSGKDIYKQIEARTGVPWWFIGLCHYRESSFDFKTYLGNGQSLGRVTTIVPKGRGPFAGPNAFQDGAVDALRLESLLGAQDWSIERVLFRLEGFNGYGYHGKGVASPYLWGGCTAYGPPEAHAGKYVSDHVFDASAVDSQLGTAVILKALNELDGTSTPTAQPAVVSGAGPREPDEEQADSVLWVQQALNRLGVNPPLAEDGINGPKTKTALSAFQQRSALGDTGLSDAKTIATLQQALQIPQVPQTPTPAPDVFAGRLDDIERQISLVLKGLAPTMTTANPLSGGVTSDATATLNRLSSTLQQVLLQQSQPQQSLAQQSQPLQSLAQHLAPGSDANQQILDLLRTVIAGKIGASAPLGQVNGALGDTIGQLLNGKKTAIGVIGAAATQILAHVPEASGLGQIIAQITPAFGLSPYTMPIFLAIAAWGALGKIEKWQQGTAPPPKP